MHSIIEESPGGASSTYSPSPHDPACTPPCTTLNTTAPATNVSAASDDARFDAAVSFRAQAFGVPDGDVVYV